MWEEGIDRKAKWKESEKISLDWETERLREWESERVREWESQRVREWESERVREWESERIPKPKKLRPPTNQLRARSFCEAQWEATATMVKKFSVIGFRKLLHLRCSASLGGNDLTGAMDRPAVPALSWQRPRHPHTPPVFGSAAHNLFGNWVWREFLERALCKFGTSLERVWNEFGASLQPSLERVWSKFLERVGTSDLQCSFVVFEKFPVFRDTNKGRFFGQVFPCFFRTHRFFRFKICDSKCWRRSF